jgi:hypothetical protein
MKRQMNKAPTEILLLQFGMMLDPWQSLGGDHGTGGTSRQKPALWFVDEG